jgi:hypothetical protein
MGEYSQTYPRARRIYWNKDRSDSDSWALPRKLASDKGKRLHHYRPQLKEAEPPLHRYRNIKAMGAEKGKAKEYSSHKKRVAESIK